MMLCACNLCPRNGVARDRAGHGPIHRQIMEIMPMSSASTTRDNVIRGNHVVSIWQEGHAPQRACTGNRGLNHNNSTTIQAQDLRRLQQWPILTAQVRSPTTVRRLCSSSSITTASLSTSSGHTQQWRRQQHSKHGPNPRRSM